MFKYLILLLSLILPLSSFAEDRVAMNVGTLGGGGAAAGCGTCNTTNDSELIAYWDETYPTRADISSAGWGDYHVAQSFALAATKCVTGIQAYLTKSGSAVCTLTIEIWDDSGGSPNVLVTGASKTLACSGVVGGGSMTEVSFTSAVSLTAATYHLLIWPSAVTTYDGDNYIRWYGDETNGYAGGARERKLTGSAVPPTAGSWTALATDLDFKIMGCVP